MKLNFWRVAAYATLFTSIGGLLTALFLDADALQWNGPVFTALVWVRIEWFLAALAESKKDDDDHED